MIKLNTKWKLFRFSIIRMVITGVCAAPLAIYSLFVFCVSLINKVDSFSLDQMNLLYCAIPMFAINIFFVVFSSIYRKKLNKEAIYEFYDIVSLTKIPQQAPKVVYVYTCHNDMFKSRVIQNARQTYKNFEVWVSEGSEKPEVIEESKRFALSHGFKFFAVGGKGSSKKADNLNAFLTRSGATFDYLVVTDSDEALHSKFVEFAIKCFNSSNFTNLGYVSTFNYCYDSNNLFTNIFGNEDTLTSYGELLLTYSLSDYVIMRSCSSVISKKLLDSVGGLFPDTCLEDGDLMGESVRGGFTSVALPIAPSGQLFDKSIKAYQKRVLRIKDWQIAYIKKRRLHQYNEKYTIWWRKLFSNLFSPVLFSIVIPIILGIAIWLLTFNLDHIFRNLFWISTIVVALVTMILSTVLNLFLLWDFKRIANKWKWIWVIMMPLFMMSSLPYMLKRWFTALFLGKYAGFSGSNQNQLKQSKIAPIKWDLIILFILLVVIAGWTLLFVYCIGFGPKISLLYIVFVTLFIFFAICFASEIILHFIGYIPSNKSYSKDDFIEIPKKFEYPEIKAQFIKDHQNDKNYDLSCLE